MSSLNPELYCLVHISVFIFNLQASIKVSGLNSAADASLCKSFLIISAAVETIHSGLVYTGGILACLPLALSIKTPQISHSKFCLLFVHI